jgi:Cu2+-exporting ATPase
VGGDDVTRTHVIDITGMMCGGCSGTVEATLNQYKSPHFSVVSSSVQFFKNRAEVTVSDTSLTDTEVINELKTVIDNLEAFSAILQIQKNTNTAIRLHWAKGIGGGTIGVAMMVLNSLGLGIPYIAMVSMMGFGSLLTFLIGADAFRDAARALITGHSINEKLTMDSLISVSAASAIGVSIASIFFPQLMIMSDAALMSVAFRSVGKAIHLTEEKGINADLLRAHQVAEELDVLLPDGKTVSRSIHDIKVGDTVTIDPGKKIPMKGTCLSQATVDEEFSFGSKKLRIIAVGEAVQAGMVNAGNTALTLLVGETYAESTLYRQALERQQYQTQHKAPLELSINKITSRFVLGVLGVAVVVGVTVGLFFPPLMAVQYALSILVSACPCTLGFIVPWAVKIGTAKAAKIGIDFKSGEAIQSTAQIDTVVFDLNGTLTKGTYDDVTEFKKTDDSVQESDLCSLVHALEENTSNLLGRALRTYVKNKVNPSANFNLTKQITNHGIIATMNNDEYMLGNEELLKANGVDVSAYQMVIEGGQVTFVTKNKKIIGYFRMHEPLRDDAAAAILALQQMGKEVHVCTGATESTLASYKRLLPPGIIYQSRCADIEKPAYIKRLQDQHKRVAMIGDGKNDEAAVRQSDVGFAIRSGHSEFFTEAAAKVIINQQQLLSIPTAFAIANQTVRNIKQSLALSFGYNIGALLVAGSLLIAIGFVINPGIGAALMVLQAGLILLKMYHFKRQQTPVFSHAVKPQLNSSTGYLYQRGVQPTREPVVRQQPINADRPPVMESQSTFMEERQFLLKR